MPEIEKTETPNAADLVLSICIPVYNGGDRAYENIVNLMRYAGNDIEIIVCDNASTDGVPEKLMKLRDCRLTLYRNAKDIGPYRNWYDALSRGKGKYLMLLLDRDRLLIQNLSAYIQFLKQFEYGVILNVDSGGWKSDKPLTIQSGVTALFDYTHPSYYVYLRSEFRKIKYSDTVYSIEICSYPNFWWGLKTSSEHPVYINAEIPIVKLAGSDYMKKAQSRTQPYLLEKRARSAYTPKGVLYYYRHTLSFLKRENLLEKHTGPIVSGLYKGQLRKAVQGYYRYVHTPFMLQRYGTQAAVRIPDHRYFFRLNIAFCHYFMKVTEQIVDLPVWRRFRLGWITVRNAYQLWRFIRKEG